MDESPTERVWRRKRKSLDGVYPVKSDEESLGKRDGVCCMKSLGPLTDEGERLENLGDYEWGREKEKRRTDCLLVLIF